MSVKTVLQSTVTVIVFVGVVGIWSYVLLLPPLNVNTPLNGVSDDSFGWKYPVAKFPSTGSDKLAYSDIRDPGGMPQGLPVRLKIPGIGVDSAIEDALITPDGRMDVPAGSKNVAWFALGPHPGKVGSAVIGGHFGITNGVPFVFYKLDELKIGDAIYIVDDRGDTLTFVVRLISLFNRNADATTVFTSDDGLAHLNLITCEGIWNRVNDTYPLRRVVFADAVPTEVAGEVKKIEGVAASPRSLSIGARGADVVLLQNVLVQRGLLTIPPRVAYGYFGSLTRTAVVKYQTSVGLPPHGVFDASTRAKIISETAVAQKPTLPITAITLPLPTLEEKIAAPQSVGQSFYSPQILIQLAKSLYATPLDALITSFLLIAIVCMVFKIIDKRHKV